MYFIDFLTGGRMWISLLSCVKALTGLLWKWGVASVPHCVWAALSRTVKPENAEVLGQSQVRQPMKSCLHPILV